MIEGLKFYTMKESTASLKKQPLMKAHPQQYQGRNQLIQTLLKYYHRPMQYKPMPFEIASLSNMSNQSSDETFTKKCDTIIIVDPDEQKLTPFRSNLIGKAKKCMELLDGQTKHQKEERILKLLDEIVDLLSGKKERTNQRLKNKLIQNNKSPQQAINLLKSLRKNRVIGQLGHY